jgi:hypothetical protein
MKFFFAFIFLSAVCFGQKDSTGSLDKSDKTHTLHSTVEIICGNKLLSHKTFDGKLNDLESFKLGVPVSYVGFGITGFFVVSRGNFDHPGSMYYTQVLPQTLRISDSIATNITGFNFGFTIHGFDVFVKKPNLDLFLNIGANTGRLRFYGNSLTDQKNPYFSPKVSMIPRFILKKISVQFTIAYEFDISKKNWRRTNFSDSPKINLDQTSSTGLTILASIGYVLMEGKPKKSIEESEEE